MYEEVKDLQSGHRQTEYRPGMSSKAVHHKLLVRIQQYAPHNKRMRSKHGVRWFIGYDITEKEPHFSAFGKNYMHRFAGTNLFERISIRVLEEAISQGYVDTRTAFIDGTHIKANANTHKNYRKVVRKEARRYDEELRKEINEDREEHRKRPFNDESDPESGLFHKGGT